MSEIRQRQVPRASSSNNDESTPQRRPQTHTEAEERGISILDIIRVLVTLVLAVLGTSYYMTDGESLLFGHRPWFTRWPVVKQAVTGRVSLTPTELSLFDGSDKALPIYIAINGSIFDVSANPAMYGPGGGYHFFAGRDATRAFITGCFSEDLTPDLTGVEEMFLPVEDVVDEGLTSGEIKTRREQEMRFARAQVEKTVARWYGFFAKSKKYFLAGEVVGANYKDDPQFGKRVLCEGALKQRPLRSEMLEES